MGEEEERKKGGGKKKKKGARHDFLLQITDSEFIIFFYSYNHVTRFTLSTHSVCNWTCVMPFSSTQVKSLATLWAWMLHLFSFAWTWSLCTDTPSWHVNFIVTGILLPLLRRWWNDSADTTDKGLMAEKAQNDLRSDTSTLRAETGHLQDAKH